MSSEQEWLNAAGRIPRLSHADEIELGRQVQEGRGSDDPRSVRRGQRAREKLCTANLRLVHTIANSYRQLVPPDGFVDLLQVGAEGTYHAAGMFDPSRGIRFSTYSSRWIRQRIQVHLDKNSRTIRAPSTICPQLRRMPRVREGLALKLQRAPTNEELGEALGLLPAEVSLALDRTRALASLDLRVNDDSDSTLGDFLTAPSDTEPEEDEDLERLRNAVAMLPTLQRQIIEAHWLPGGPTLSQFARQQGIPVRRCKDLLELAMRRLKELRPIPLQLELPLPKLAINYGGAGKRRYRRRNCHSCDGQMLLPLLTHERQLRRRMSTL